MKRLSFFGAILVAAVAESASVSGVSMSAQDETTRLVEISYSLSHPAIVTFAVQESGTNIYPNALAGDVNKSLAAGQHKIWWRPDASIPNYGVRSLKPVITTWSELNPPPYLAVDLNVTNTAGVAQRRYFPAESALPGGIGSDVYRTETLLMRRVPAQDVVWRMGSTSDDAKRQPAREYPHYVMLTNDYWMCVFELTQYQYRMIAEGSTASGNPSLFTNETCWATRPAECLKWNNLRGGNFQWPASGHAVKADAAAPCPIQRLRLMTGMMFDLPTSAEWEFACRAGTKTAFNNGKWATTTDNWRAEPNIEGFARYGGNSGYYTGSSDNIGNAVYAKDTSFGTARVGSYKPNDWGLYDMHGNVWEWVLDGWTTSEDAGDYDSSDPNAVAIAPKGPNTTPDYKRVVRGSSWDKSVGWGRSSSRAAQNGTGGTSGYTQAGARFVVPIDRRVASCDDLYLLIGQSNMAGRGLLPTGDDVISSERVYKFTADEEWAVAEEPIHFDTAAAGAGPGLAFARKMIDADPSQTVTAGLIPCAVGGSALSRWMPDADDLYPIAVARAKAALATGGRLRAILWHQGEGDSWSREAAESYSSRLQTMVTRLRADLNAQDVPFIAGKVSLDYATRISSQGGTPYVTTVNAQLEDAVPRLSPSGLVSVDGLQTGADTQGLENTHFVTKSAHELGERYAAKLQEVEQELAK